MWIWDVLQATNLTGLVGAVINSSNEYLKNQPPGTLVMNGVDTFVEMNEDDL